MSYREVTLSLHYVTTGDIQCIAGFHARGYPLPNQSYPPIKAKLKFQVFE